jgi:hypothetical protein
MNRELLGVVPEPFALRHASLIVVQPLAAGAVATGVVMTSPIVRGRGRPRP